MPYQVSGQLVEMKFQKLSHVAGVLVAAAAGGAFVTMLPSARATVLAAVNAKETVAKTINVFTVEFFMASPSPEFRAKTMRTDDTISFTTGRDRKVYRTSHRLQNIAKP